VRLSQQAGNKVMAVSSMLVNYLKTVTPADAQSNFEYVEKTLLNIDYDVYDKISAKVVPWGQRWVDGLEQAYATGDAKAVWSVWGEMAGQGVGYMQAIVLQLFVERVGASMVAKAPQLEEAAVAATEKPAVLTTSKGGVVTAGRVLSLADQLNAWGFPEAVVNKLDAISKKFNVLIGARSRQAISVELENLGALWKNSNFHQKTVSYIDRTFLGMDSVRQGLLAFRSFTPAGEIAAREAIEEAGLSTLEKEEAFKRLDDRISENASDFAHTEELAEKVRYIGDCSRPPVASPTCKAQEGWINAGFNANESGRAASRTSKTLWRRFELQKTAILGKDGELLGYVYEPYQESIEFASAPKFGKPIPPLCKEALGTVLCPVTGDIDLVYITNLLGGSLTPTQMWEVFSALEDAGFAHTDLVTWVEQMTTDFMFENKAKQLAGLVKGFESCVQWAPDGLQRATYLAPLDQSLLLTPTAYWLNIVGGYEGSIAPALASP
jgi:hypothetical protein